MGLYCRDGGLSRIGGVGGLPALSAGPQEHRKPDGIGKASAGAGIQAWRHPSGIARAGRECRTCDLGGRGHSRIAAPGPSGPFIKLFPESIEHFCLPYANRHHA